MRLSALLALFVAAGVLAIGSAQARQLADPIEGTWGDGSGGEVTVSAEGKIFVGNVTKAFPGPAGECLSVGLRVWTIDLLQRRGEGRYAGKVIGYVPGCQTRFEGFATWDLGSDGNSLHECADFGVGAPVCSDLKRVVDVGRVRFTIVKTQPLWVGPAGKNGHPGPGYDFSSGAGSIDYMGTSITEHGATTFTYHFFNGKKQTIVLKILGLAQKPDLDGPAKSVKFRVKIKSGAFPNCATGGSGTLLLVDQGSKDAVSLALCSTVILYRKHASARGASVSVTITSAG